ncbi:protein disulfide-isomerase TMX3a isoform X2 [Pangasianodon hypophthalmus]|uniref:protein disulfide-isomerase TMX3a isoform X2 n=1 Tax=Pangasianodon hypophthalmus TaxID=310915 RepID=UPI0023071610|nr:protein disulfide-isomerase TMX3a isoform X2 [Pangasianodon hypophthalmus]
MQNCMAAGYDIRHFICSVLVVSISLAAAYVEELDDRFNEMRRSEPWLVEFYAPWCEYCKTFEPIWYEVAAELKSQGSHINVGKLDTTVYTDAVTELKIRGYPSIIFIKGDKYFHYNGQKTKDAILEFTYRVSGPSVRALTSVQLFQHVLSRHQLFFVYVGGRSPLKGQFYKVASEFLIHNYFFSATVDVLPQAVTLQDVPSVVVFKDGAYDIYNEVRDGNLSSWVDRERFPRYFLMDSFSLYQMGERTKLVAVAVVDEKNPSAESSRYKSLVEKVATEYSDQYSMNFQFGYVDGNDYINGVIMGELPVPSLIVMNMSIDGYYLPGYTVETIEDLLQFLNSILTGRSELLGGNGFLRRIKRLYYRATSALKTSFASAPFGTCFLISLPLVVIGFIVMGICTAERVDDEKADDGTRSAVTHRKKAAVKHSEAKKKD